MTEIDVPVFELCRPVSNVEGPHIESLRSRLLEGLEEDAAFPEGLDPTYKLFHPVSSLRSILITRKEFLKVQHFLGKEGRLNEEEVEELGNNLAEALVEEAGTDTRKMNTLPVEFTRHKEQYTLVAGGNSPYSLKERHIAKMALARFLDIDETPRWIWYAGDKKAVHVRMATSQTEKQRALIGQLIPIIEDEVSSSRGDSLPGKLELARPEARRWHDP